MDEIFAQFSMCFAFLFLFEGIEIAIKSKANMIYKVTHIFLSALYCMDTVSFLNKRGGLRR